MTLNGNVKRRFVQYMHFYNFVVIYRLDYGYIDKCNDSKRLKLIHDVLKSGKEGDLISTFVIFDFGNLFEGFIQLMCELYLASNHFETTLARLIS